MVGQAPLLGAPVLLLCFEFGGDGFLESRSAFMVSDLLLEDAIPHSLAVAAAFASATFRKRSRQTKVTNFHIAFGVDQNVSWFDVPMENIGTVEKLQSTKRIVNDGDDVRL
jgi:hypothetical protein